MGQTYEEVDHAEITTVEDAIAALHKEGFSVTREEFLATMLPEGAGELDESSLEGVSGGAILPAFLALLEKLKGRQSRGSSGYYGMGSGRHG